MVVLVALAAYGTGVEGRLKESTLVVPGSEFEKAIEMGSREFGEDTPVAVLLRGPARELDRQGPAFAKALRSDPRVHTLSPWDNGETARRLRPRPDAAVVIGNFRLRDLDFTWVMPHVERAERQALRAPVRAHATGMTPIGVGAKEESLKAAHQAERIALPVLLLVLLFVFRSPVAAAIPLVFGALVVAAGRGAIGLATELVTLDAAAITLASMMGLALGVDYALLIVSRFREELDAGRAPEDAARVAGRTAGRTVVFAGVALLVAMLVVLVLSPGALLVSMAAGVGIAVLLSVAVGFFTIPAALVVAGHSINRWCIGGRGRRGAWTERFTRLARRPAIVVPVIALGMALLASPVAALDTGPVDPRQLPAESKVRRDYEAFKRVLGPGWAAPIEVVVASPEGPITASKRLRQVAGWERELRRMPGAAGVYGPGPLIREDRRLARLPRQLERMRRSLRTGARDVRRLDRGLDRAHAGVGRLRDGLRAAGAGAGALRDGARRGAGGAARLRDGAATARDGADRLAAGLRTARAGARRGMRGMTSAERGARTLRAGAADARRGVRGEAAPGARRLARELDAGAARVGELGGAARTTEAELAAAWRELEAMSVGKTDPRYAAALRAVGRAYGAARGRDPRTGQPVAPGYEGLADGIDRTRDGMRAGAAGAGRLAGGLDELDTGLGRLESGAGELASGLGRLRAGGGELASGLARLEGGAERLAGGIGELGGGAARLSAGFGTLGGGADRLASGLTGGERRAAPLEAGLGDAGAAVGRQGAQLGGGSGALAAMTELSPGLFDSGYLMLAALDGARPAQRRAAEQAVSLDRGGRAVRLMIIPEAGPNDPRTRALLDRVQRSADALERRTGVQTGVGGAAPELATFDAAVSARFIPLVIALALVTWLTLVVIFRALLLPLVAVVLNLLTVGAAFGILAALVTAPGQPLGGADFLDAISAMGIFTVTFALSIDYEVFLLARMREGWVRYGDTERAVTYGLQHTAGVVTGAALIMTGVFLSFATSDVAGIRQFGVGLAIAVILDATVVRLVLLPAAMRLIGDRNWWLPGWLDRRLPHLDVEGERTGGVEGERTGAVEGERTGRFARDGASDAPTRSIARTSA
jgi:RND superfamily putative drug exporter